MLGASIIRPNWKKTIAEWEPEAMEMTNDCHLRRGSFARQSVLRLSRIY
jgi:hypothetical protein